MAAVLAAFEAYKASESEAAEAARAIVDRAEARLGREIVLERRSGVQQRAIAARLGRTREQVRRYERAYYQWIARHPEDDLAVAS